MEFLYGENSEQDKSPDKTGESKASKKSRKKVTKVPKAVVFGQSKEQPAAGAKEKPARLFEKSKDASETQAKPKETEPVQELELPKVAEYAGELVIDHSDETRAKTEPGNSRGVDAAEPKPEDMSTETDTATPERAEESEPLHESDALPVEEIPEPPRVAPPLFFEFPPEVLRRPEGAGPAMAGWPEITPFDPVRPEASGGAPAIPSHALHPGYHEHVSRPEKNPAEPIITEKEARRREYRAHKHGVSRGVTAGGLAGYIFGKYRGKRIVAEQMEDHLKERDAKIKELVSERDTEREVSRASKERLSVLERTKADFDARMKRIWQQEVLGHEQTKQPEVPMTPPVAETLQPVFEVRSQVEKTGAEAPVQNRPERQQEQIEDSPESNAQDLVPENHRVEMSAWHRIEVDKTTGHVVEAPAVAYGEAFAKEQKQEKLARDAAKAQTAAQVGMTLLDSGTRESSHPLLPKDTAYRPISPLAPAKSIRQIVKENMPFVRRQLAHHTTNPVVWAASAGAVALLLLMGVL